MRIAHALLVCAGLVIALYPFTFGADASVTCRGVRLQPGQSCAKADGSATQTYEERRRTALQARPVVAGVGLMVAVFGVVLLVGELRPDRRVRPDGSSG